MKTIPTINAATLLFTSLLLFSYPLKGQQQSRINPKVEVQRDYEGQIMEVAKPKLSINIPDSISQFNIAMDYTIFDKPYHDLYAFTPLPSVHLSSQKTEKLPWVYMRIGTLWQTSPVADLLVQAPLSNTSSLLLTAQHQSFRGELPRYQQAGKTVADNMLNKTNLRYGLNWENGRFEIGGGYDYNYYTYYGIAPSYFPDSFHSANLNNRTFMRDSMSHAYNLYHADIALSSLTTVQRGVEWGFSAGWRMIEDRARLWNVAGSLASRENLIRFKGEVGFRSQPEQMVGVAVQGAFSNNLFSSEIDRGVFALYPYYQFNKNKFALTAGVSVSCVINYETASQKANKFFIYPQLALSYQIIPSDLMIYANLKGENRLNDYQSLMAENPWLSQTLDLRSSDIRWNVFAGVKGKIAHHLGYNLYGQYIQTNNQYYFHNSAYQANLHQDTPYPIFFYNLFAVDYADEDRLSAIAELSWVTTPLALHLTGKYHTYTLSTGTPAWYKPQVELNLTARYQWRERIIATAGAAYQGKVFASELPNPNKLLSSTFYTGPSSTKIDEFIDLSLKLEYRFASWFGIYIEGKNLLNAHKQYYLYYYEPGARYGGGITIRF